MITGFGNNVISSLAADITAGQTTIQVMPGTGAKFAGLLSYDYANASNPLQTYAKITLTDAKETVFEICHLTSVNNDVLTVVRGQEGTTAKGWALNDVIANFATRGSENQFVQIEQLRWSFRLRILLMVRPVGHCGRRLSFTRRRIIPGRVHCS